MERKSQIEAAKLSKIGGASRDRTDDLIVANDALSQLSYSPKTRIEWLNHFSSVTKSAPNHRTLPIEPDREGS